MPLPPLSHHEILGLIEPFTRRGRRVDLDASDRLARKLIFQPQELPAPEAGGPTLREALTLESPYRGTFRLERIVTHPGGLRATLRAEGPTTEAVLEVADRLDPHRQFHQEDGLLVALQHQAELGKKGPQAALLSGGEALVRGLRLTLSLGDRGAADLALHDPTGEYLPFPEDLLTVLGWNWSPLRNDGDRWSGRLRLRGRGLARSRRAEAGLQDAARHLARTLAEPPASFHARFLGARWLSVLRRVIPLLTAVLLVAGVAALPSSWREEPGVRLVVLNLPLLLIGLSFTLQERSRVEVPPLPRPLLEPAWRRGPDGEQARAA